MKVTIASGTHCGLNRTFLRFGVSMSIDKEQMEASVLRDPGVNSPTMLKDPRAGFLRLQSDERLVSLTRRGNDAAFETLIGRYRVRLLAFSRHMVGSAEDAEDILQEVWVAAHRAILADDRSINVRPWLYRIARNRSLNHLRRPRPTGLDSMDVFEGGAAVATADRVHDKLDLEDLVEDVKRLPETQRTALMLREMGDLSYEQISETMETSIPSVKSLLVRARVSLAEAAESRRLTCDEVRLELGAVAEGLQKISPPVRRHLSDCDRCSAFKKELAGTNRKLAVLAPVGGLLALKNFLALKIFGGGAAAAGSSGFAGAGGAAGAAGAGAGAAAAGAGMTAGLGTIAVKVGAGLATAAIVTGGVAKVATNEISRDALTRGTAITQPAGISAADATGGVAPGPVVPAEDQQQAPPAAADAADAAAEAEQPDAQQPAEDQPAVPEVETPAQPEIVDEEHSTAVVEPGGPSVDTGPSGPTGQTETPGMPTPPQTSPAPPATAPAPPPPAGPTGSGGVTGSTAGTSSEPAPPSGTP